MHENNQCNILAWAGKQEMGSQYTPQAFVVADQFDQR